MSNILELHNKWRGFSADRAKARREIDERIEKNNAEIERLRLENIDLNTQFQSEWSAKKKELQEARDRAVMEAMAGPDGRSGQDILRELGSRNTVWIYDLRKRLAAEGRLVQPVNENSPIEQILEAKEAKARKAAAQPGPYAHMQWLAVPDPALAGWSITEDFTLVKRERRGGVYFICGPNNEFLDGDKAFYDSTDPELITHQADALMDRIEPSKAS